MKHWVALVVTGPLLLLAGCDKKPGGQIVAVVNGEEVAQQELNDEVQSLAPAPTATKQQLLAVALDQIVSRKLLAQQAKKDEVDRTPEFITHKRKLEDSLLIAAMVDSEAKKLSLPTQSEIDSFVAAHPTMFAARKRFVLQSLVFPASTDAAVLQRLRPLHTLDEIATTLTAAGIAFSRASGQLDSATLPPQVALKLEQLPQGEPFVIPQGNNLTANVIVDLQPVAMNPQETKPAASQLIRNEKINALIRQKVTAAKSAGKIAYGEGFGPPTPPKTGASAAPAK